MCRKFYFTDIGNSQGNKTREETIQIACYHFHVLTNIMKWIDLG